ncbi:MAG: glycosyltransferase family 4 protein [Methanobacteriota archaeon]|nr:MAG: glycosyltransferase family 4 protein [Euryarchaeota archaeon]
MIGYVEKRIDMKSLMIVSNNVLRDARVQREGKSIANAGHQVRVIGWDRKGEASKEQQINGIQVTRIRNSFLMKIAPSDLFRNPMWWRLAYKEGLKREFDLVHCHDLDTLQSGVKLKKKRNTPLVFDAHEIFSYMIEEDVSRIVRNYAERMERSLLRDVDHIITVNEALQRYYRERFGGDVSVVMNCPEEVLPEYEPPSTEEFTILYIGTLHKSRFVRELVDVISSMEGVQLKIGGEKELYGEIEKKSQKADNIHFLGTVPLKEVIPHTRQSNVIFCMFDPASRINQVGSPNKIFEAMAMGRPTIVTKGILSGEIIEKEKCGLAVEYSEESLRNAIEQLRDDSSLCEELGKNGLKAAQNEYNWKAQEEKLLRLMSKIQESI